MKLITTIKTNNLLSRYQRPLKFCIVGGSGALIGLGILYLLTDIVGLHYLVSNVVAFACSVSNNYLWNSKWTFRDKEASLIGYNKYVGVSLLGLGVNETILWLLTALTGMYYMISAAIAIVGAFLVNYILSKRLVWVRGRI